MIGRIAAEGIGPDDLAAIARFVEGQIERGDRQQFIASVTTELHHLDEGNIARYRLRRSQLAAWVRRLPRHP